MNTTQLFQDLSDFFAEKALPAENLSSCVEMAELLLDAKEHAARIFLLGDQAEAVQRYLLVDCRVYDRVGLDAYVLPSDSRELLPLLLETHAHPGDVLFFTGTADDYDPLPLAAQAQEIGLRLCALRETPLPCCDAAIIGSNPLRQLLFDGCIYGIREELKRRWGVQIVRSPHGRRFKAALFDFDGTISLVRADWHRFMVPYFTDVLQAVSDNTPREETEAFCLDFIDRLAGKQTIFQCMVLDEEIVKRGGAHVNPEVYKQGFLDRMGVAVRQRRAGLQDGTIPQEDYRMPGSIELVQALESHGIRCYVASGTDERDVLTEAHLIGVDKLFSGGIRGARPDITGGVKEQLLQQLIDSGIRPEELLTVGDGFVEMDVTHRLGGYAIGVVQSDDRIPRVDERKRQLLLSAGADMIVPDYENTRQLLALLEIE